MTAHAGAKTILERTLLELQVVREDRDQAEGAIRLQAAKIEELKAEILRLTRKIAILEHPPTTAISQNLFMCSRCGTAWKTPYERDACEVRHAQIIIAFATSP